MPWAPLSPVPRPDRGGGTPAAARYVDRARSRRIRAVRDGSAAVTAPAEPTGTDRPARALGGRRPAAGRPDRPHPADRARGRRRCWSSSTPGSPTESKYYRFFAPMPDAVRPRRRALHPGRPRRPGRPGADRSPGEMIAVGRYDVVEPTARPRSPSSSRTAHQGRGIAQLLLEHLAQAGRERGVERFVAEVLPDNQPDDPDLPRRRLPGGQRLRGRRADAGVPHRPHRHRDRRDARRASTAPRRPRSSGSSTRARSRSSAPAAARTPSARRWCATWCCGDFTGRVYVVNPSADAVSGHAGVQDGQRHPRRRRRRDRRGARPTSVQDVVLDCAAKGVHGLVVISVGLRRDRRGGPPAPAPAGRAVPLLRPAADRPQLPRRHQHRPRGLAQRLAVAR